MIRNAGKGRDWSLSLKIEIVNKNLKSDSQLTICVGLAIFFCTMPGGLEDTMFRLISSITFWVRNQLMLENVSAYQGLPL